MFMLVALYVLHFAIACVANGAQWQNTMYGEATRGTRPTNLKCKNYSDNQQT